MPAIPSALPGLTLAEMLSVTAQPDSPAYTPNLALPLFYAGSHRPGWLWDGTIGFPLMVSDRQLRKYASYQQATVPGWCLDSGGFTELQMHGRWTITGPQYVARLAEYDYGIGKLEWAAPRDLMCDPIVRHGGTQGRLTFAGTGLTEERHQRMTVENYVNDVALWPQYSDTECPIIPVIQGWERPDSYERCYRFYEEAGVNLSECFLVGVGSVCRQQSEKTIRDLVRAINQWPIVTHWFGVKLTGVRLTGLATEAVILDRIYHRAVNQDGRSWTEELLIENGPKSLDSLAWSEIERRKDPWVARRPGCTHRAEKCSGCRIACAEYRDAVNAALARACRLNRDRAWQRQDSTTAAGLGRPAPALPPVSGEQLALFA